MGRKRPSPTNDVKVRQLLSLEHEIAGRLPRLTSTFRQHGPLRTSHPRLP